MGIDFHNSENKYAYTSRQADDSWTDKIKELIPVQNIGKALDIACGGGIYSKALADLGIPSVTGVDFSKSMLAGARKNCSAYTNISFQLGNAFDTGLAGDQFDLLLERALIHHIQDLNACFTEAAGLLKQDGYFIVQDRTPEDCLLKGDQTNIRGYFFEVFPKLIEKEISRRHSRDSVLSALNHNGFKNIQEIKFSEKRAFYQDKGELLDDLRKRNGRSILHELDDRELELLIDHIDQSLSAKTPIVEKDRWTLWIAEKA